MAKLLQNKLPITCLLSALLILWLGDVLGQPDQAAVTRPREIRRSAPTEEIPSPEPTQLSILPQLRDWVAQRAELPPPERLDPFAYDVEEPTVAPTPPPPAVLPSLPTLRGMSLGSGKPLAVLDHSVVGVGDSLGPWRVDHIDLNGVRLSGPEGTFQVQLTREPAASATPKATARRTRSNRPSPIVEGPKGPLPARPAP